MANSANILLHGLFFLQYQGNNLIAMTPDHGMHEFRQRPQGLSGDATVHPFPPLPTDIDLTALTGRTNSTPLPFPSSLLQFSSTDTGVGNLTAIQNPKKNYRCRIVLPWPLDIIILRASGSIKDYHALSTSNVGQSISKASGPGLGIVTLLHYETAGSSFTINYFAEHLNIPGTPDVNVALKEAGILFEHPTNFDLQLSECSWCPNCGVPPICPDKDLPPNASAYGVLRDDEHSIREVYQSIDCSISAGTDVVNCVQFGINQ